MSDAVATELVRQATGWQCTSQLWNFFILVIYNPFASLVDWCRTKDIEASCYPGGGYEDCNGGSYSSSTVDWLANGNEQ